MRMRIGEDVNDLMHYGWANNLAIQNLQTFQNKSVWVATDSASPEFDYVLAFQTQFTTP
ncbi:MAG: hypothetical protein HGB01_09770 [Chlorobiaceae bacterium]|nr:hypothetical protein [Chlorobiaceae bacterium]